MRLGPVTLLSVTFTLALAILLPQVSAAALLDQLQAAVAPTTFPVFGQEIAHALGLDAPLTYGATPPDPVAPPMPPLPSLAATAVLPVQQPIANPFAGTLQFWSTIVGSIESVGQGIATAFTPHQSQLTDSNNPQPSNNLNSPPVAATTFTAAVADAIPNTATSSQTNSAATSDQTTQTPFVKSAVLTSTVSQSPPATPAVSSQSNHTILSQFVKSRELSPSEQYQFDALSSRLNSLTGIVGDLASLLPSLSQQPQTPPTPQQFLGDGNPEAIGAGAAIDQLSNVTINNPSITGLSVSDIPNLSGSYLSLNGGTLTGAFVDSGTASSSFTGALGIGTTSPSDVLAVNGPIYLANVTPAATTNRLYSNAGSLYWAGSPIAGGSVGNWTTDGTNVWRTGGNVGIGTTSPFTALSVAGNGYLHGNLTTTGTLNVSGTATLGNASITNATSANLTVTGNGYFSGNIGIGIQPPDIYASSSLYMYKNFTQPDFNARTDVLHIAYQSVQSGTVSEGREGIEVDGSDASTVMNATIVNATNASPIVITTSASEDFNTGDKIDIYNVGGNTAANGTWIITAIDSTDLSLNNSTGNGAYTSGGTATNRGLLYGYMCSMAPLVGRGGMTGSGGLGSNSHGDDLNCYTVYNGSSNSSVGGDAIYIGHNPVFGTSNEWATDFSSAANAWKGIVLGGTIQNAALDLSGAALTSNEAIALPNAGEIQGLNTNGSTFNNLLALDTSDDIDVGSSYLQIPTSGGNAGHVGIGTSTPASLLTLSGSETIAGNEQALNFQDYGNSNRLAQLGIIDGYNVELNAPSSYFQIITNRVGIGTSTPLAKLSVTGQGTTNGYTFIAANNSNIPLFNIQDDGLVGIATTTPSSILSVQGVANFTTGTSTYYSNGGINLAAGCFAIVGNCLTLSNLTGILPIASGGTNIASQTTNGVNYFDGTHITSGTGLVYSAGDVGIGTTTPNAPLDILTPGSDTLGTESIGIGNSTSPSQAFGLRLTGTNIDLAFDRLSGGIVERDGSVYAR